MHDPFTADIAALRTILRYDHSTGIIYTVDPAKSRKPDGSIGYVGTTGYIRIRVNGKSVNAHRLAWALYYGKFPTKMIDHIDGDKTNNRISNLREADCSVNSQNRRRSRKDSGTGLLGVSYHKKSRSFRARVRIGTTAVHDSYHQTPQSAHAAYLDAKRKLHSGCTI